MNKNWSWRKRRDKWFRMMFVKLFAEWHEVKDAKSLTYDILWFPPLKPQKQAKHADYKGLETRLKAVERKVCDHKFCDAKKGCIQSIVCSKCGALDPAWEPAPRKRYDDNGNVRDGYVEPKVFVAGTGYIRKENR